jgi:antitoxin ParD1/3/4
MTTLNISLPKSMKTFVESQLSLGGYSTASEYVRDLIREAQKKSARQRLERLLLEGLDSGPTVRVDENFWKERREKLRQGLRRKKSRK